MAWQPQVFDVLIRSGDLQRQQTAHSLFPVCRVHNVKLAAEAKWGPPGKPTLVARMTLSRFWCLSHVEMNRSVSPAFSAEGGMGYIWGEIPGAVGGRGGKGRWAEGGDGVAMRGRAGICRGGH